MTDNPQGDPPAPEVRKRRSLRPLAVDARRLAELLSLGLRTIRTMDSGDKLPRSVKIGARKLWVVQEIRDWLRAGCPDRVTWDGLRDLTTPGRKGVGE